MSQKRDTPRDSPTTNPQNKRSKLAGTRPSFQNLLNNPDDYFFDVVTMVGLGRLQDLRRVCQSWNTMISQMISQMTDITNRRRRIIQINAASDADKIKNQWVDQHTPRLSEITNASYLAHHGLLFSVEDMWLDKVDLASVKAEHLA